jgi:hypothetical protein
MDSKETPKAKNTTRGSKKNEATAVQKFLPIAEIRQDTVLLKNGGHRAVLLVASTNFSLKSDEEQEAIIRSYQQFVNSLNFPIQIVIRSQKLNIDGYLGDIRKKASEQKNPLLKEQTLDYAVFIERLIEVSDIMQKRFYVVVPMDAPGVAQVSFLQKYLSWLSPADSKEKAATRKRQFEQLSSTLRDRVNIVQTGLENVGLLSERLKTHDLIELFYQAYNPSWSRLQKLPPMGMMHVKEYVL